MKYGETLRQRSIPAWSHHNIDYDEIKLLIKENTTPGRGKTISVPGRGDDKLSAFESQLLDIFVDQHHRIDLFVRSKAGEIQRRLDHSKKQIRQLASRQNTQTNGPIPVARLERYGRIENDVMKAGDEIKSLARFTSTQRTAIRKLLKKYRKWTGSSTLEDRFRGEVLDDPKGFTKVDLGPLLDEYSSTRQSIRTLYENSLQSTNGIDSKLEVKAGKSGVGMSSLSLLQDSIESGSNVYFDTAIETVPLGDAGIFASYFVHPENIVELQMLLLQYSRFHSSRSRSNSIATPVSSSPNQHNSHSPRTEGSDYHMMAADSLERFVLEQSALTVNDREHAVGSRPQRAKASVRWSNDEDALASVRVASGRRKTAVLKKKHVQAFLDRNATLKNDASADHANDLQSLRKEIVNDADMQPLFHFSSCRSRFVSLGDRSDSLTLAALDANVSIQEVGIESDSDGRSDFPFAILLVRQEGIPKQNLISALDTSYLVERVRGFSLEYHALWQALKPKNAPLPFWLPILSRDIRRLPPPIPRRLNIAHEAESGTQSVVSRSSSNGFTEGTTAVETTLESPLAEEPPLKSFRRKKKRLAYDMEPQPQAQKRYWSEYDHPEDGDDAANAYVIFVDPNERSAFDKLFDRVGRLFSSKGSIRGDEDPFLSSPASPGHDESSSTEDEESGLVTHRRNPHHISSFGTFPPTVNLSGSSPSQVSQRAKREAFLPPFTAICFTASLVVLFVAYLLAFTGRRRYVREVDAGILFSIICSLIFAVCGLTSVFRRGPHAWRWTASIVLVIADVVGSGGLLAYMFA